jgi:hypothetical protein
MAKFPGAVFLIEDCEQLFSERAAQTLLRGALGGERVRGRRERKITFSVGGSRARVLEAYFFGSLLFTANKALTDEKPEVRAVLSRIPSVMHSPPDDEIRALMRHVARKGFVGEGGRMSPHECLEVVEAVIRMAAELESPLDLRWIEHGYAHFLTQVASGGAVDWRDQTKFHMLNMITFFDHRQEPLEADRADDPDAGRPDKLRREIDTAMEIARAPGLTSEQRVDLWEQRTRLSRATYFRRLLVGRDRQAEG